MSRTRAVTTRDPRPSTFSAGYDYMASRPIAPAMLDDSSPEPWPRALVGFVLFAVLGAVLMLALMTPVSIGR